GWLPYPPDPADYATASATIRDTATRPVTPALFATVFVDDDAQRGAKALDDYCRATYRMPLESVAQIQVMMSGPDIAARLGQFVEAGARHILLRIGAVDSTTFTEQLARVAEILPTLPHGSVRAAAAD
ncbi:LLM class flavin-dependent oxidoreductase, partial [Nocardia testacea]